MLCKEKISRVKHKLERKSSVLERLQGVRVFGDSKGFPRGVEILFDRKKIGDLWDHGISEPADARVPHL